MKYVIWNNKGGVGKTFLTYTLATQYAKINPSKEVVVLDLCPQANVSEMILGGNGKGEKKLDEFFSNEKTIASYIKHRYHQGKFSLLGRETSYFIRAHDHNEHMPENLYLLPGDCDLDICANIINFLASAPEKKAWQKSRCILTDLIDSFQRASQKEQVYFFDCNPSFASYTELAIVAADRLIIPCTADAASLRAIHNVFRLIYGIKDNESNNEDPFDQFYEKASANGFSVPKIHCVIQNRSRVHQTKASKAFTAHIEKIKILMSSMQEKHPDKFTNNNGGVRNIKDGNTLAAVINHTGKMLGDIAVGKHAIYDMEAQVSQAQKDALVTDINDMISIL